MGVGGQELVGKVAVLSVGWGPQLARIDGGVDERTNEGRDHRTSPNPWQEDGDPTRPSPGISQALRPHDSYDPIIGRSNHNTENPAQVKAGTPEIKARMFEAGADDAVLTRSVTGKPCRTLRSAFTDAWDAPGAPDPLPAPLQAILWWGQGRTRVERVRAEEFLTYPVGQIVADMREETSVRQVVHDMLGELAEAKERLDRLLG